MALNNDELHALLRLRGKLNIQNPLAVEVPELIMAQMPSLPAFREDADGNRVPFMAQGTEALARLKEMNPKMDTNFAEKETNDDLAYYLQVQSSLSHLQTGVEDKIWEDQRQLIKSVKADYAKRVDSGELVPTGSMSYVDFIPDKDIPEMPELLQELIPNPPPAAPKTTTTTQTPPATTQTPAAATQNSTPAATGTEAPAAQEIAAPAPPAAQETKNPGASATPTPTPTHTPAVATPKLPRSQPAVLAPQHRLPFQQMYHQQFYAPQYGYQHPQFGGPPGFPNFHNYNYGYDPNYNYDYDPNYDPNYGYDPNHPNHGDGDQNHP